MKKKHPFSPQQSIAEAAYASASESEQESSSFAASAASTGEQHSPVSEEEITQPVTGEGQIPNLEESLLEAQKKAQEYLEALQRERAEFVNYKKRIERDQQLFRQEAVGNVVKRYLPIVDDLELALKNKPEGTNHDSWVAGIELIYQKMLSALAADGVTPIGEVGEVFDPTIHEAISQAESDEFESGKVIDIVQKGYIIGDKVLRPALVRVAA